MYSLNVSTSLSPSDLRDLGCYTLPVLEGNEDLYWFRDFLDGLKDSILDMLQDYKYCAPDYIDARRQSLWIDIVNLHNKYRTGYYNGTGIRAYCRVIDEFLRALTPVLVFAKKRHQFFLLKKWKKLYKKHNEGMRVLRIVGAHVQGWD